MYKTCAVIVSMLLCSCSGTHIKKHETHNVSPFSKLLAKEYKDFASTLFKDGMWLDSKRFHNKSNESALGAEVLPEDVEKWKEPASEVNNLMWASYRLSDFSTDYVKENHPDKLAHSQMLFDCWVERAAKKMKPEKIEECRMDFVLEMSSLENELMPIASKLGADKYSGVVYFRLNDSEVDAEGMQAIDSAIGAINNSANYVIKISGYTDGSGANNYNTNLAAARASKVVKHLTDRGVDKKNIEQASYNNEKRDAYNKLNRRVEIDVSAGQ